MNKLNLSRQTLPACLLSFLPFTLFFPVGVTNIGILLFLCSLLASGQFAAKWQRIKSHVLLLPILSLSLVSCLVGLFMVRPEHEFWSGFGHYQTYLFLLLFISIGGGAWQQRATQVFFAGAVLAASLFYLNALHVLPFKAPFTSYVVYGGNKSILLGILLAIAAGWMLFELVEKRDRLWLRGAALLYVVVALVLLSKTRTGNLIFVICAGLVVLRYVSLSFRASWRSVLAAAGVCLGLCAALGVVWVSADGLRNRLIGMVHDVEAFSQGQKVSDDGIRLEMYKITAQMIMEKPWTGHGVATWMVEYQERAKGLVTGTMTTPHNDYLLYATEIGLPGLAALLWIWLTQCFWACRLARPSHQWLNRKQNQELIQQAGQTALPGQGQANAGMQLAMLTVAMMLGGMFNAILRDAVFGLALMILLAIPLAGLENSAENRKRSSLANH